MDIQTEKEKMEIRTAKIFAGVMVILFVIVAITSFVYAYLTKGTLLLVTIFLSSSILAIVAWLLFSNIKKLERRKEKAKS